MSGVVTGRNMILEVKVDDVYYPIACASSCLFEFQNELIGKTDVNAGLSRKKRVRIGDNRASVQGLTTIEADGKLSVLYFLQEAVRRSELDLRFTLTDESAVTKQIQGIYLVASISANGEVSAFAEFDIAFEGTGGISISDVDDESGTVGLPGQVLWDWWEVGDGDTSITGPGHYGRSFTGQDVIEVDREGIQYDYNGGAPVGRTYDYDGTTISFDPLNPMVAGARVFVIWQAEES